MPAPEFAAFCKDLTSIFEASRSNRDGKVADYIPQLGRVDPELFGLAICTVDGHQFALGDADTGFCLQSCCKPITYALALEEHGEAGVHRYVGREPSGHGFNEITLDRDGKPHNPMINAGAIMGCSLIRPGLPAPDRFDYVMDRWRAMCGGVKPGFNNAVYLSERQTADRNFALGYFLQEHKAFPKGTNLLDTLEFYFQCCAVEITAKTGAVAAATLAAGGICPLDPTKTRVLQPRTVQNVLSLMHSCGMYDFSGEFAFTVGLPAKSGVSGGILVVVPGVLGLCVWSPRVDRQGNSQRGVEVCKRLVAAYDFHPYAPRAVGDRGVSEIRRSG